MELSRLSEQAIEFLTLEDFIAQNPDDFSEDEQMNCRNGLAEVLTSLKEISELIK
jgi:hypothetical protein